MCVLGFEIMLGMGGQISFAQAGFWGLGAYTTAIATVRLGFHPLIAILISAVFTTVFAVLLGSVLFRLKGHYFGFATIGVVQILMSIFQNWTPVTGGADGIPNIPNLDIVFFEFKNSMTYYYVLAIIAVILALIVYRMKKTSLGRALEAIRDNEVAAQCMGVNVFTTKNIAFGISAFFASIAGSLWAFLNGYISATTFSFEQSTIFLIMLMIGGVTNLAGAFIGAILLTMLPELLRFLQEYILFVYGLGIILTMVFMPQGLVGGAKTLYAKFIKQRGNSYNETLNRN